MRPSSCAVITCQESFLAALSELQPDLAVTAAYGNMLPQRFLDTPRLGTLNVHPSLLPRYRGAAPVQRALEVGARVCVGTGEDTACMPALLCGRLGGAGAVFRWGCVTRAAAQGAGCSNVRLPA